MHNDKLRVKNVFIVFKHMKQHCMV